MTSKLSQQDKEAKTTPSLLPEFNLVDRVILITGAGRGLGLVQAETLIEAGAIVYGLDRLLVPDAEFERVQEKARKLGTRLEYRQLDVTDVPGLNVIVDEIADKEKRIDGLIAAAGVQKECDALSYTAEDAK
jgi:NAD(P)-dependent dehydrogenase (short-subunit alcohol dehydrogenase family)